jgi:signal transduction histidine kinase
MPNETTWLGCGVLRAEMEELHRRGSIKGTLVFLDSMLHMVPEKLDTVLTRYLEKHSPAGGRLVLVHGDCCPRMLDLARKWSVGRINAINCAQMLLGKNRYREMMREGAFMLLPEWALRWREIMQTELGLTPEVARDLIGENRRVLVYLDTGLVPVPQKEIEDCAAYSGLPWRIEKITLDTLLEQLLEAEASVPVTHRASSPAEQLLVIEVFCELLASTDPAELGPKITGQIQELTGARVVLIMTHVEVSGSHRILHASPVRKANLFLPVELVPLCPNCTPLTLPRLVSRLPDLSPVKEPLQRSGISNFLRVPLKMGNDLIGIVLLLDLPEENRMDEINDTLQRLSPMMAVSLRNAFSHEQVSNLARDLEKRVAEQTADLLAAKEKAEESDRLKTAFLANMSHEIRTPMNGILGFLEVLQDPALSSEERKEYIEIVNKSGQRLLETINDIIEISKIETGTVTTHLSDVSLREIMNYHHDFFDRQASEKGLGFFMKMDLPEGEDKFTTDRHKLDGILTNLIRNAIKFTDAGSIKFGCRQEGGSIVFHVRDTGRGIPLNKQETIFGRFVQADNEISMGSEGSGLGLSIVKAYVGILGGRIRLESEVGSGSLFQVTIPRK